MSNNYMPVITMMLTPIVTLVRPVAGICMSLCLISQGFSCTASGVGLCSDKLDLMIAGAIASVIVAKGASYGFAVGIVCYIMMVSLDKWKADVAFNRAELAKEDEMEREALALSKAPQA